MFVLRTKARLVRILFSKRLNPMLKVETFAYPGYVTGYEAQ